MGGAKKHDSEETKPTLPQTSPAERTGLAVDNLDNKLTSLDGGSDRRTRGGVILSGRTAHSSRLSIAQKIYSQGIRGG